MKRICLLSFILYLLPGLCRAQSLTWDDFVQMTMDDEQADREDWAEHMELLAQLHAHPLNINTATREDLEQLPMLDEEQIMDIHEYMFLHRGMRSLSELMAIRSIDARTRRLLGLFVYAGPWENERQDTVTLRHMLRNASHEVRTHVDIPLYYRAGYMKPASDGGYVGQPVAARLQYRMQDDRHLSVGLKADKDGGEPFRGNSGFDFYSGYVMLKDIKRLKAMVVGDYRLGFGQGLVMNKGYSFGKAYNARTLGGIRAHTGMDEVNYLRGAAATVAVKNINISSWLSHRQMDATLDNEGRIKTLQSNALHRTATELQRKNNVSATMAGASVQWAGKQPISLGATGYVQHFSHTLAPGTQLYRAFYPQGQTFGAIGVNYAYRLSWLMFQGETAYSPNRHGWATINSLTYKPRATTVLTATQRYYDRRYYSFHASALSDNGAVQNESGITLRIDAEPWRGFTLNSYVDFFYNPWPRYGMTHSSAGAEWMMLASYTFRKRHTLSARYQWKTKERYDQRQWHNRVRLKYSLQVNPMLRLQTLGNIHFINGECGVALSQSMRLQSRDKRWSQQTQFTWFHTPSYDSRVYVSEPMLQNTFFSTALMYHGLRLAATASVNLWQNRLRIEARYAVMRMLDHDTQSTGLQEIRSPWRNDISVQLRLKI